MMAKTTGKMVAKIIIEIAAKRIIVKITTRMAAEMIARITIKKTMNIRKIKAVLS